MIHQNLGSFSAASANGSVSIPLRSLLPDHAVLSFQLRITATLTAANANGPYVSADLDAFITQAVSRLRIYGGGLIGEPINVSTTNLRSDYMLRTGKDVPAFVSSTGVAFIGSSVGNGSTAAIVADYSLCFTDGMALSDPDWCAPSTNQLKHEGFFEITYGALGAASVTGSSATATPSAVTVELIANLVDVHGVYLSGLQVLREQSISTNSQNFEPALYLGMFDTRNAIGSSAYNPTYQVEKDGKSIISNMTGQNLALSYLKHASLPGSFDVTQRVGPILFLKRGYSYEDLKPSLAQHTVRTISSFTSGTVVYRAIRPVQADQERQLAQHEGFGKYRALLRPTLGKGEGDVHHGKVAMFAPRWIAPQ